MIVVSEVSDTPREGKKSCCMNLPPKSAHHRFASHLPNFGGIYINSELGKILYQILLVYYLKQCNFLILLVPPLFLSAFGHTEIHKYLNYWASFLTYFFSLSGDLEK